MLLDIGIAKIMKRTCNISRSCREDNVVFASSAAAFSVVKIIHSAQVRLRVLPLVIEVPTSVSAHGKNAKICPPAADLCESPAV